MGCSSSREKLESRMLMLKLKRIEIKQEREERIKALEKLLGKKIPRKSIPDYIEKSNNGNDDNSSEKIFNLNNRKNSNFVYYNKSESISESNESNSFKKSENELNYEREEGFSSENYESEVLKSDKPVILDFWAPWCGPCKALAPKIQEIAEENPDIKVCLVNVDENMELAK